MSRWMKGEPPGYAISERLTATLNELGIDITAEECTRLIILARQQKNPLDRINELEDRVAVLEEELRRLRGHRP